LLNQIIYLSNFEFQAMSKRGKANVLPIEIRQNAVFKDLSFKAARDLGSLNEVVEFILDANKALKKSDIDAICKQVPDFDIKKTIPFKKELLISFFNSLFESHGLLLDDIDTVQKKAKSTNQKEKVDGDNSEDEEEVRSKPKERLFTQIEMDKLIDAQVLSAMKAARESMKPSDESETTILELKKQRLLLELAQTQAQLSGRFFQF